MINKLRHPSSSSNFYAFYTETDGSTKTKFRVRRKEMRVKKTSTNDFGHITKMAECKCLLIIFKTLFLQNPVASRTHVSSTMKFVQMMPFG